MIIGMSFEKTESARAIPFYKRLMFIVSKDQESGTLLKKEN